MSTTKPKSKAEQKLYNQQIAVESLTRIINRISGVMIIETHQSKDRNAHYMMVIATDTGDLTPRDITATVARALDRPMNRKQNALIMHGCGMNMRADLAGSISKKLFGDYYTMHFVEVFIA